MNTCAIMVVKTIKNTYSNASFSSVTAATESLGLSDNGFKRPKKQFESSNILELGYQAACGGRGGGHAPEHYAHALRCNTAGPF